MEYSGVAKTNKLIPLLIHKIKIVPKMQQLYYKKLFYVILNSI